MNSGLYHNLFGRTSRRKKKGLVVEAHRDAEGNIVGGRKDRNAEHDRLKAGAEGGEDNDRRPSVPPSVQKEKEDQARYTRALHFAHSGDGVWNDEDAKAKWERKNPGITWEKYIDECRKAWGTGKWNSEEARQAWQQENTGSDDWETIWRKHKMENDKEARAKAWTDKEADDDQSREDDREKQYRYNLEKAHRDGKWENRWAKETWDEIYGDIFTDGWDGYYSWVEDAHKNGEWGDDGAKKCWEHAFPDQDWDEHYEKYKELHGKLEKEGNTKLGHKILKGLGTLLGSPLTLLRSNEGGGDQLVGPGAREKENASSRADQRDGKDKEGGDDSSGKIVGFWIVPTGNTYTKVKIQDSYKASSGILKRNVSVNTFHGNQIVATWALLSAAKILAKHFSWFKKSLQNANLDALLDPKEADHMGELLTIQKDAFNHGWYFAILRGDKLCIADSAKNLMQEPFGRYILEEILGKGHVAEPSNVRLSGVPEKYQEFGSAGKPSGSVGDISNFLQFLEQQEGGEQKSNNAQGEGNEQGDGTIKGVSTEINQASAKFQNMDNDETRQLINHPDFVSHLTSIAEEMKENEPDGNKAQIMFNNMIVKQLVAKADSAGMNDRDRAEKILKPMQKVEQQVFGSVTKESKKKIVEASFKELYNMTVQNGKYKYGGMRKITGRGQRGFVWVYDRSVPGRVENGTRFVVTRDPKVRLDNDGSKLIKYNFKSRADRSTTGMRQTGYIRFLMEKKGWMTKLFSLIKKGFYPSDWERDIHVFCTCFSGDSLVLMGNGTYKPIEDVREGDKVVTHTGAIKPVLSVFARPAKEGECRKLKTVGFPYAATVTADHPFYAVRGQEKCSCGCGEKLPPLKKERVWSPMIMLKRRVKHGHSGWSRTEGKKERSLKVPAKFNLKGKKRTTESFIEVAQAVHGGKYDYSESVYTTSLEKITIKCHSHGDFIQQAQMHVQGKGCPDCAVERAREQERASVPAADEASFQWVPVSEFRHKEWFVLPWTKKENEIDVDPDLARLVGYYAAEGHIPSKNKTYITLNGTVEASEDGTIVKDIRGICAKLGYSVDVKPQPSFHTGEPSSISVRITSGEFSAFCKAHVGRNSLKKTLSNYLMNWTDEALRNFVVGAVLGDGNVTQHGRVRFSVGSHNLLLQTSNILSRLRVRHTVSQGCKEKEGKNLMLQVRISPQSNDEVYSWLCPYLRDKDLDKERKKPTNRHPYDFEEGQLRAMTSCKPVPYSGLVYDLRVADDKSYVVNGIATSNCPDFKFRWHYVLGHADMSHIPQGGAEALNQYPHITNPRGLISMCKHLVAVGSYLQMSKKQFKQVAKQRKGLEKRGLRLSGQLNLPPVLDSDPDEPVELDLT